MQYINKNNSYNHLLAVKDDVSTNEEKKTISRDKLSTVFPFNLDRKHLRQTTNVGFAKFGHSDYSPTFLCVRCKIGISKRQIFSELSRNKKLQQKYETQFVPGVLQH